MATVNCPQCRHTFDPTNHFATAGGGAAGAAAGAAIGAGLGIVGGPIGGIAGTIPGAIIGGTLAALGVTKFAKCPGCSKVFMI
jgi:outer membrane lipoprotein SlyB